jgi:CheY-like chemotaxis protein
MGADSLKEENGEKQTILIVDEDPVHLRFISERLESEGFRIITAGHGEQGMRFVDQRMPDLVLLDVLLPDMDGMDMLSALKRAHPEMPVVIVTGLWDEQEGQKAFKLGAFDYITKPVVMDYLKLAILSALSSREEKRGPAPIFLAGDNYRSEQLLDGRTMEITTFPFRVGRESRQGPARFQQRYPGSVPNNDLYLEDSPPFHISREHFQIEHRDRQYFVRDRGSSLGLCVNDREIGGQHPEKIQKLQRGDNIVIIGGPKSPFRFKVTI